MTVFVHLVGAADIGAVTYGEGATIADQLAHIAACLDSGANTRLLEVIRPVAEHEFLPLRTLLSVGHFGDGDDLVLVATKQEPQHEYDTYVIAERLGDLLVRAGASRMFGISPVGREQVHVALVKGFGAAAAREATFAEIQNVASGISRQVLKIVVSVGSGSKTLYLGCLAGALDAGCELTVHDVQSEGKELSVALIADVEPWLVRRRLFRALAELLPADEALLALLEALAARQAVDIDRWKSWRKGFERLGSPRLEDALFDLLPRRAIRATLMARRWLQDVYELKGGYLRDHKTLGWALSSDNRTLIVERGGRDALEWLDERRSINDRATTKNGVHALKPLTPKDLLPLRIDYPAVKGRDPRRELIDTLADEDDLKGKLEQLLRFSALPSYRIGVVMAVGQRHNDAFDVALRSRDFKEQAIRVAYGETTTDKFFEITKLDLRLIATEGDDGTRLAAEASAATLRPSVQTTVVVTDRHATHLTARSLGFSEDGTAVDHVIFVVGPGTAQMSVSGLLASAQTAMRLGCGLTVADALKEDRGAGKSTSISFDERPVPALPGWNSVLLRVARQQLAELEFTACIESLRSTSRSSTIDGFIGQIDALGRCVTGTSRQDDPVAAARILRLVAAALPDQAPWHAVLYAWAALELKQCDSGTGWRGVLRDLRNESVLTHGERAAIRTTLAETQRKSGIAEDRNPARSVADLILRCALELNANQDQSMVEEWQGLLADLKQAAE